MSAQHAGAAGACGAVSQKNFGSMGFVVTKPSTPTACSTVCAAAISNGLCYSSMAVSALGTRATAMGVVGKFFWWDCNSPNGASELTAAEAPDTSPIAYCCCYL